MSNSSFESRKQHTVHKTNKTLGLLDCPADGREAPGNVEVRYDNHLNPICKGTQLSTKTTGNRKSSGPKPMQLKAIVQSIHRQRFLLNYSPLTTIQSNHRCLYSYR
mmetsp:Transcript_21828/g.47440  ORF Transcript_21828/g.47440 Transcript_21828/m.47440 type:complete len:106 (+) Transcript_21828:278-595(+)